MDPPGFGWGGLSSFLRLASVVNFSTCYEERELAGALSGSFGLFPVSPAVQPYGNLPSRLPDHLHPPVSPLLHGRGDSEAQVWIKDSRGPIPHTAAAPSDGGSTGGLAPPRILGYDIRAASSQPAACHEARGSARTPGFMASWAMCLNRVSPPC